MADRIVQAKEAFSGTQANGVPWNVGAGDLYWSNDPIVKGREHLFGDVTVLSSTGATHRETATVTGSAVETATAEPGQRRRMGRSRLAPEEKTPASNSEASEV